MRQRVQTGKLAQVPSFARRREECARTDEEGTIPTKISAPSACIGVILLRTLVHLRPQCEQYAIGAERAVIIGG